MSISLLNALWATPETLVWVLAPPSSSCVTFSFVTDLFKKRIQFFYNNNNHNNHKLTLTTSGPVTKRYEVSLTIKMKSVIAGEYTAPPAHGPIMTDI